MNAHFAKRNKVVFFISSQHPWFKKYRRLMQVGLNPRAVKEYEGIQTQELHRLMKHLATNPSDFYAAIRV